jgi:hypothetical protein
MKLGPALCACLAVLALPGSATAGGYHLRFMRSAKENAARTKVTLPLYHGTSNSSPVSYVITDVSSRSMAHKLGVNFAPKLANTAHGRGAQLVTGPVTALNFPATVDFAPNRVMSVGDYGQCAALAFLPFGPDCFAAGAVGRPGYSPLAELPDGTVVNASHVANSTGHGDKVTVGSRTATIDETEGRAFGRVVHYLSVDASVAPGAVLENVTVADELKKVPGSAPWAENANHSSARAGIIAFTNGQTGLSNPQRQGLNSTLLDSPAFGSGSGLTTASPPVPVNILQFVPSRKLDPGFPLYSPLWDVHFATWALPATERRRMTSFSSVQSFAAQGAITNPSGGPFGSAGAVIANCPIVSMDLEHRPHPLPVP